MTEIKKQIHWVMDYETLVNCFIGVFSHFKDETITKVFVIHKEQNDLFKFVEFLHNCVKQNEWHISFNGLGFDGQITQY